MVYYVTTTGWKEDTLHSARVIILRRIQCVYLVYFCWSDLLYILRFAACSFAVPCSLNVHLLLWLKSLEALRLTIFHPLGLTDSELWIRVQPSDFPRLVHHCKRMKSYLTWATMMGREAEELLPEADTFSVGTENNWCPRCLNEFNFCRL